MTQSSALIWGQWGDAQLLLGMFDLQSVKNEPCGSSAAHGTADAWSEVTTRLRRPCFSKRRASLGRLSHRQAGKTFPSPFNHQ